MKRLITPLLLILSLCPAPALAQKKVIAQAQQYIKTGKDLDKAEKLMTDLLKDSANRDNVKIHLTLFEAVKKQYEAGNEKLYLKQAYDTTALFNNALKMFDILERLDSIERQPTFNGKNRTKWRERNVPYLDAFRVNLLNGGRFFTRKQQYARAFLYYTHYIDCDTLPLFRQYHYAENDTLMPRAAYGAMYCAYKLERPHDVLRQAPQAEKVKRFKEFVCQFEAEAYRQLNDTANYIQTLRKGFSINPGFAYFFPRIVDYYIAQRQIPQAIAFVDEALKIDSLNPSYRFAQSTLLLNTGHYEECIEICEDLIAENDSLTDAYYNIGLAYFNEAVSMDVSTLRDRNTRNTITQLYKKSLPFMERVREDQPDQRQKWMHILYTIYLNLNMGDEFDEINQLINNSK